MGILISDEAYDVGLSLVLNSLKEAIKNYEDYLLTYGTVPDMILVEKLNDIADRIRTHDRTEELNLFKGVD